MTESILLDTHRFRMLVFPQVILSKQVLLLTVRISAIVPVKASIFIPVIAKVETPIEVASILKVYELHC